MVCKVYVGRLGGGQRVRQTHGWFFRTDGADFAVVAHGL